MTFRNMLRSLLGDIRRAAILNLHALFTRLAKPYLIAKVPVPRGPTTFPQFADYFEKIGEHKRAEVMRLFATPDLLKVLPFMDIIGGAYTYTLDDPEYVFPWTQVERLKILGGALDTDKALIHLYGIDFRDRFERQKIASLSSFFVDRLINGDATADPREFDGLKKRIAKTNLIDAAGPITRTVLDDAINRVDAPTHLIMNRSMKQRLARAWWLEKAESGFYSYTTEDGETSVEILLVEKNDKREPIIPKEGNNTTSIYVVSIGDAGFCGLQNGPMVVDDLGEVNDRPVLRTRIEWLATQAVFSKRAAARIHNIYNAPIKDSDWE